MTDAALSRWQPYPAYKPSGVEWLGDIPAHWEQKRLKYLARTNMGQSPSSEDYNIDGDGIPFLQGNADFGEEHPAPRIYCTAAKKTALPGDILISVRAPVGALNVADQEYGIGRGLCAISPYKALLASRYTRYMLEVVRTELDTVATGSTYDAVAVDEVGDAWCLCPSLEEQRAIAAFLDRETTRLDALIAKKQRLIELLQEKRTALISQAVTKGLDPNVAMKDSGVEWLGEIPAHWDMKPLGSVARLQRGHDLTTGERLLGDVPVYSSSGFSGYHNEVRVKGPGVVTGRYGTIGKIFYVEQDYWPMNTTLYVCDFKGNYPRFIYYLLMVLPFDAHSNKSAVPGVDRNDLHPLQVTRPPLPEQVAIAAFLDQITVKLDALIARNNDAIERLREYRTALISAAVTGKIDVREAATGL